MTVPTIQNVKNNIIQDIEARINQTVKLLPKAFIRVLAAILAAIIIQLYKYIGWLFLQIFVTAGKAILEDIAPAVQTVLEISVDVEILNSTLPAGTQFTSTVNNVIYITTQDFLLDTDPKTIQVTSATSGSIGNLDNGAILTTVNPLGEIASDATVTATIITGIDKESENAYRNRVLQKKQSEPQGGSYADYRIWSVEVSSVINAYPYSGLPGQVLNYIKADRNVFPDGIPDSAKLLEVAASIDQADRRPVTAIIDPIGDKSYTNIRAITRTDFDVDVKDLIVSNPSVVQQDIEDALDNYFFGREPFIDGLTPEPRKNKITLTNVTRAVDDIVTAAAGTFTGVAIRENGTPVSEYILGEGETAKLGVLSFV